ncbi:MAG: site-2 protease family protein [Clostridia bacterium]|nr:site-2 protease family protein [Clostridia bacterium]
MSVIGSILTMILILSLLTVVHEWGHYLAARIFKVKVNEFSIFMGPKIFSRVGKKTGTRFSIRCLPLGGFCALEGEEETKDSPDSYCSKPWYQRAVILVAGVLMNFILAILIISVIFAFDGYDTRTVKSVNNVQDAAWVMPMALTDLEPGDEVIAYNGKQISTPADYSLYLVVQEAEDVTFTVRKKDGTKVKYVLDRTVDRQENKEDPENPGTLKVVTHLTKKVGKAETKLGTYTSSWENNRVLIITLDYADGRKAEYYYDTQAEVPGVYVTETATDGTANEWVKTDLSEKYTDAEYVQALITEFNTAGMYKKFGFSFTYNQKGNIFQCVGQSFVYAWSLVKSVFLSLWWFITGKLGMDAMAGPIGITSLVNAVVTAEVATSTKFFALADMTALISANLAVFNLLPVPGLDGGKLLFIAIERIRGGKQISPETEGKISLVFFALLILLSIVIAGNDIINLIR